MRSAAELPRRRFWPPRVTGRGLVIALALAVFVVIVFGRGFAQFYVDALWHDALGRGDVFWGQIGAKVTLFVIFFLVFLLLAVANLFLADRAAPSEFPANVHPYVERFHELFGHRLRFIRYGTAAVLAFMLALPATAQWQDWLLFRNSVPFGVDDPQFGIDVGFYVFELPFLSFALDWLFAALIIILLLTMAAHLLNGGVLFTSTTPTVRPATRVHLAALLAVLAAVKAGDYWITRYELTNETRGFVQGATYTVVNAQIPALMLLMLIALLTAGLYLWTIRTNRWRIPIVASGLWLVVAILGGVVFPAVVQGLVVRPNQEEREAPFIARNVEATRAAMNIDDVSDEPIEFSSLTSPEIAGDLEPLQNTRLLNPRVMLTRFSFDRGEVAGLRIADLDIDRRTKENGEIEQTLVAARELDLNNIPNTSWQGRHLVSTRGCGLIVAPTNRVNAQARPIYEQPNLDRPQLYFSPTMSGYAITRTDVEESDCGGDGEYEGEAGVEVGGVFRRAAFALAFLDYNIIGSGAINSDSQMLWRRSVNDRVRQLAPFLNYDGDPYPVAVNGTVQWVIDGYTSTSRYPYAQRIGNVQLTPGSGLPRDANYVRNSVKAVVDAYTGEVTFFVMDPNDPILQAWSGAFPDLFTPLDEMSPELRERLRYPEDLFRVQTDLYSKYQVAADDFFQRRNAWSVAQAPPEVPRESAGSASASAAPLDPTLPTEFATESNADRFIPYYTSFRNPQGEEQFVMLRPFVRFSRDDRRTELQAFMTASSEPDTYGQLRTYVVTNDPLPSGPLRVSSQAETESDISREITLQNDPTSGKRVLFGDMQILPVADGLVYVRPVYVEVNDVAEYRFVIVSHNDRSAMACDLTTALDDLFNGFRTNVGDRVGEDGSLVAPGACQDLAFADDTVVDEPGAANGDVDGDTATDGDGGTDATTPPAGTVGDDADAAELIARANQLFAEADAALADGDLGGFQEKFEEGAELIARADALLRDGG
jgi:uncharacterized membrane protein (UPF0182 family)